MDRRSFLKGTGAFTGLVATGLVSIIRLLKPKKRKLKVAWSCELEQDLQCFYDIKMDIFKYG